VYIKMSNFSRACKKSDIFFCFSNPHSALASHHPHRIRINCHLHISIFAKRRRVILSLGIE